MIVEILLAAAGTAGFAILFNAPKRQLAYIALTGSSGWAVLQLILMAMPESYITATLLGAMVVTFISRTLSAIHKMPATVYLVPGIIPLVPGVGIYNTMFYVVMGDNATAVHWGLRTAGIAGTIAVGLLIVLSLPVWLTSFGRIKRK